jgi:hypothetical protein
MRAHTVCHDHRLKIFLNIDRLVIPQTRHTRTRNLKSSESLCMEMEMAERERRREAPTQHLESLSTIFL